MNRFSARGYVALAAFLAFAASAAAQDQMPPPAPMPTTSAGASGIGVTSSPYPWFASGFVGSNFGNSADSSSVDFGGSIGYLWRGYVGPEFQASFAPRFQLANSLLAQNPNVNSYVANLMAAVPLGLDARWQPYVSGGFGAIQLRSDVFNLAGTPSSGTTVGDHARFGGDIGFGLMGYLSNVGFRADARYFQASNSSDISASTPANAVAEGLVSGIKFWRANVGLALRW
jgi:hypothetical protein